MTTDRLQDVVVSTVAERPEYTDRLSELDDSWPEFMGHDLLANLFLWRLKYDVPEHTLVATDGDAVVAVGRSVPFRLDRPDRGELPANGWDRILVWADVDRYRHEKPDTVSALEIAIDRAYLGRGLSHRMLGAMRDAAIAQGYARLVAPVRPNGKTDPYQPMTEYVEAKRPDGLPADPWLRVHVRAGGEIVGVAPTSMIIAGTLEEWRRWTGLPFDASGPVVVPGALAPVTVDLRHGTAVYVEPNVWVRHDLTR